MTELEARLWVRANFGVSRETRLDRFVAMLLNESGRQNLISASSADAIWHRHIVDSAQLLAIADHLAGPWIDIGTGAGFPGLVIALLSDRDVTLIEPRRRRAEFLNHVCQALDLGARVKVVQSRSEQFTGMGAVISARAVASLPDLLASAVHLSTTKTLWLLPKGTRAMEEVAAVRATWHGVFHVKHSITDPNSLIITAEGVARR